ncbi:MAG TPA: sialidase family protein [Vicinamibacterales bacterium]|nr:sialidase family protein [Vicinamibacterales bacterium]
MKLTAVLLAIGALAIAPRGLKPALYDGRDERRAGASAPAPTTIGIADRINQHVSIGSAGDVVAVVWAASKAGSGTGIYAAISRDEGRSFSGPVRVNGSMSADVGGEQPPQVAVTRAGGAPTVIVVWTSKGDAGTRLMTARSSDGGKAFGVPSVVPGSDAPGNRGWESITVDARGRVVALWLDHREMARGSGGAAHHHGAEGSASASPPAISDGAARAQASQLYFGSLGGNASARGIARGVCYCCKTALVTGSGDTVSAAWRHVYPGNVRDMAFAASRDGGRTFSAPVRVSEDGWQIDGCPENGPALAVDRDQRTHVVWPTVVRDKGQSTLALFHASTKDGRAFTARSPLPVSGPAYHPRLVTMADGSLLAAWDEVVNGARRIRLARGRPDAEGLVAFTSLDRARPIQAQYPALAATSSGAALAWSTGAVVGSRISVERIAPR